MYEKFFQLEKTPFSIVPDPNCVHLMTQHKDAISGLIYGVLGRKGYLVLTGEAGLGKTTALCVMSQLMTDAEVHSSVIFNPILTASEFLEMVLLNFGFSTIPSSKTQRLKLLQDFLIRSGSEGKVCALIVDEAHKLSADLLEEVRLLGNFEADAHKLLQIVLVGQNELNDRLDLPELWQLKQRIALRMSLQRLDRESVEGYLEFRWNKAGGKNPIPFTNRAVDGIASWSKGIPRLINAICDNALLIAFSEETASVDVRHIREACVELHLPTPGTEHRATSSPTVLRPVPPRPLVQQPLVQQEAPAPPRTPVQQPWPVSQPVPSSSQNPEHASPHFWTDSRPSLLKRWLRLAN